MLRSWIQAFRPKTLTAAVVPILVATALVKALGFDVKWLLSFFTLFSVLFIQIGTNLFNDIIDFKKGADGPDRLGPRRVTQNGDLTAKQVFACAGGSLVLATAFGWPLILEGGWPILIIGVISLFLAYSYTGGAFPLAYLGLGDFFVILFFGVVAVMGLFYIHTHEVSILPMVAGLQVGFLATVLIVINNLRDHKGDGKVGKKTMAVRFGERFSKIEIVFLITSTFLLNLIWFWKGWFWAAGLPFICLPIAYKLIQKIWQTPPSEIYNKFLAQGAILHLVFGILLTIGLFLSGQVLS